MKVLIIGQGVDKSVIEELIAILNKMPELVISEDNRQYDVDKMYEMREYNDKRNYSMYKLWKGCEIVENNRKIQISKSFIKSTKNWSINTSFVKQRRSRCRNHN